MNHPPGRQQGASTSLIGACLIFLSTASVCAQTFQEAACYVFKGKEKCQAVTIVDQDNCIIKVRPRPLANLDPSIAGCLIDDIQTTKFFLRNARPEGMVVANDVRAIGKMVSKSTVQMSGREVVHVLTKYDQNGAPIWEPRNTYAFELEGDPDRIRKTLEHLSLNFCSPQTPAAGPMPLSEDRASDDNTIPHVIGVNEAFRLAAQGRIVLIDIRHESEWRWTGIGVNAIPITMYQSMDSFVKQLRLAAGENNQGPIALICARGDRSSFLQKALKRYGFPKIIDVHEGMSGGPRDQGWIKSGLPIRPYTKER